MSEQTAISWCDSTFNPWLGCSKISPACDHCYAERLMDHRMRRAQWGSGKPRVRTSAATWKQPLAWERNAWRFMQCHACGRRGPAVVRSGSTRCRSCDSADVHPARRRVFCASLADVFDNEVPAEWRRDLFNLILSTPHLDWLLLTKRIGNVARMLDETLPANMKALPRDCPVAWPWPNVWLGITVVNQAEANRDIPKLLTTPAEVRFLSIEPMLGLIDLQRIDIDGHREIYPLRGTTDCEDDNGDPEPDLPALNWVICGGESGPHARPMRPGWVRSLRDQCAAAGVPLHFKQWGEWAPERVTGARDSFRWPIEPDEPAGGIWSYRVDTKAAGRLLDGRTHDEFPA